MPTLLPARKTDTGSTGGQGTAAVRATTAPGPRPPGWPRNLYVREDILVAELGRHLVSGGESVPPESK